MVKTTRTPAKRRFYARALTAAESAELSEAGDVLGIDEEITALRVRLRSFIEEHPEDLPLLLRGMEVLRRMVVSKYGLSRSDAAEFESTFAAETLRRMKEERGGEHDNDHAA